MPPLNIKRSVSTTMSFGYEQEGLNLSFSLKLEKDTFCKFRDMLKEAVADVEAAIEGMESK